jgi:GTP-binding protein
MGTERLFVDEAVIHVRGGRGGDGCVGFRREKFIPKGGPDGGDGGHGGSVYLEAQAGLDTLLEFAGKHHWHAESGRPGEGGNRSGKRGAHLVVPVPVGTLVYDADTGNLLKDLVQAGQRVRVARGGRGGRGNAYFATSTNQAPREFQPGGAGQERTLRLELKLIADAGFLGLPNAGKSTLLSRLTRARPKIAAYPFTTREPHLGIAELPGFRRLVLADLPGLIEGAHQGVGLGHAFLRHIERTRVIVHLIDLVPPEGTQAPAEAYRIIRRELEEYSASLAGRPEIIVGNKLDLTDATEALEDLRMEIGKPVLGISGVSGEGLRELLEAVWSAVAEAKESEAAQERERGTKSVTGGLIDFDQPADAGRRVTILPPEEDDEAQFAPDDEEDDMRGKDGASSGEPELHDE